jgi:hypothetical protein
MDDETHDLPPCMWCGKTATRELTSPSGGPAERWFECGYCRRLFCVIFKPEAASDPGETKH